jgi:ABC-type antimicrobial peptide transport system permease subunit
MRWLSDEVAELTAGPRFSAVVLSSFAAVALIMASLGVYGVMGFVARQRTREIGVRQALGATRQQVLADLMRDAIVIVVTGLATGLVAAVWLARSLTGVLHEVTPADPVSLVLVGAALATAGLVAGLIPARRATRINLLSALRED